jgi:hypothetical protein
MFNFGGGRATEPAASTEPDTTPVPVKGTNVEEKNSPKGLDAFSDLWDTTTEAKVPEPPLNLAELVGDEKALQQAASQRNFLNGLSPEILAGLDHLGTDAKQTVLAAINLAGQNAWQQALQAASTLSQRGMDSRQESLDALIADKVKDALDAFQLQTALPANQHPTVQMAIRGMANELRSQDPTLSPAAAAAKAREFYTLVGRELLPAEQGGRPAQPVDWNAWLNAGAKQVN